MRFKDIYSSLGGAAATTAGFAALGGGSLATGRAGMVGAIGTPVTSKISFICGLLGAGIITKRNEQLQDIESNATSQNAIYLKNKLSSLSIHDKDAMLLFLNSQEKEDIKFEIYLRKCIAEKDYSNSDIIRMSNIDKSHFYQILRGVRKPIRDTVIKLAIILGLSVEETDLLLQKAKHNELYAPTRRDAIIIYCLSCQLKLDDVDDFLNIINESPLF